jgi:hypothetical protein
MAFKLITPKNTRDIRAVKRAGSLATTVDALYFNSITTGSIQLAVAATTANQVLYKANETTTASTNPFSATIVSKDDEFLVDTVNNSNAAHNGQRMILGTDGLTLNNTGTDVSGVTGVFVQLDVVGVNTDKKIIARRV